jgi:regulatory protein
MEVYMRIDRIEEQKKNKDRVSVFINNKFAFGLHKEIAQKFALEEGKEIESELIKDIIKQEEQSKANNYALRMLSFRSKSEKEMKDNLSEESLKPNRKI